MKTSPLLCFLSLLVFFSLAACGKKDAEAPAPAVTTASGGGPVFAYETESPEESKIFTSHIADWMKSNGFAAGDSVPSSAGQVTIYKGSFQSSQPFQLEMTEAPASGGAVHFTGKTVWTLKGTEAEAKTQQEKVAEFTKDLQKITGPIRS